MAVASDSIPTPARPLLPFADPRTAVEILDVIRREVEWQQAGCGDITIPSAIHLWPAPAPLPSLPTAFSRRRAIFGAVAPGEPATGAKAASAWAQHRSAEARRVLGPTGRVMTAADYGMGCEGHEPLPGEPQTARSIGMGPAYADLADVVDLASLAAGQRRHAYRMAADAVDHLIALMDALDADVEDMEADSDDDVEYDDGREAEPDDEDGGDRERDLGWNETVSQLALGVGTDDGDLTALERHGRGFIRSGSDDSEDDDGCGDKDSTNRHDIMTHEFGFLLHQLGVLAWSVGGYVA